MQLERCLYIINPANYEHFEKRDLHYEKLRQVQWLVDDICNVCIQKWSLGKLLTIDKIMVSYKGSYCPIC
jgi:hypothetical protein